MNGLLLDSSVVLAALDPGDANYAPSSTLLAEEPHDLVTLDLARHEVANVATTSWQEPENAASALAVVETLGGRGGLIRSDMPLLITASEIAARHSISVYDASYVAAAQSTGRQLVSCDERDLVSKGLAILPADAL